MAIQKLPPCCRRVTVGGHEQLIIETSAGQRITLNDGTASIVIEDTSGNSIRLENGKVTVSTPGHAGAAGGHGGDQRLAGGGECGPVALQWRSSGGYADCQLGVRCQLYAGSGERLVVLTAVVEPGTFETAPEGLHPSIFRCHQDM